MSPVRSVHEAGRMSKLLRGLRPVTGPGSSPGRMWLRHDRHLHHPLVRPRPLRDIQVGSLVFPHGRSDARPPTIPRREAYEQLARHIDVVLEGIHDEIAEMATVSALVHNAFGFLWTGFYRVVEPGKLMRVGPYQGTLGCLEIAFGRGVCGTAAAERELCAFTT